MLRQRSLVQYAQNSSAKSLKSPKKKCSVRFISVWFTLQFRLDLGLWLILGRNAVQPVFRMKLKLELHEPVCPPFRPQATYSWVYYKCTRHRYRRAAATQHRVNLINERAACKPIWQPLANSSSAIIFAISFRNVGPKLPRRPRCQICNLFMLKWYCCCCCFRWILHTRRLVSHRMALSPAWRYSRVSGDVLKHVL